MTEINRRTVTKGIAWSVPALAVAGAAPAFAISGRTPTIKGGQAFKLSGNSCKDKTGSTTSGNKAYLFTFQVTNNDDEIIYLYGATISTNASVPFSVHDADPDWGTAINPGYTVDVTIWGNGPDSGNTDFTAIAQVFWGHVAPPATLTLPITSNAANPDRRPDPNDPAKTVPWHGPVQVGPWNICGTPTLPSQDLEKCENPGYIPVPATCPQPTARTAQSDGVESANVQEPVVEGKSEPIVESTPEATQAPAVSESAPTEADVETTVVEIAEPTE